MARDEAKDAESAGRSAIAKYKCAGTCCEWTISDGRKFVFTYHCKKCLILQYHQLNKLLLLLRKISDFRLNLDLQIRNFRKFLEFVIKKLEI